MARKAARRHALSPNEDKAVKVTIRLDVDLAKRLGVAAALTRRSQSSIASDALRGHLAHVRLGTAHNLPTDRHEAVSEATGAVPGDDPGPPRSGRDDDAA